MDGVPDLQVEALIQDQVSCLHDYTITTDQMKKIERADAVILSGAGLEDFVHPAFPGKMRLTSLTAQRESYCWERMTRISGWTPRRYAQQGENIAKALGERYPDYADKFQQNMENYEQELMMRYEQEWYPAAQQLSCKELITFHDGFSYFADAL